MTAWTLRAGTFVIQYDWLFLLVLILLAPVDRAILDHLRRGPGGQRGDRRWSVLMMALPLGLGLIMVVTLLIPLIQLNNQLLGNLSG
jgi:hypothetical protein